MEPPTTCSTIHGNRQLTPTSYKLRIGKRFDSSGMMCLDVMKSGNANK